MEKKKCIVCDNRYAIYPTERCACHQPFPKDIADKIPPANKNNNPTGTNITITLVVNV